jgi:hypothetical protein
MRKDTLWRVAVVTACLATAAAGQEKPANDSSKGGNLFESLGIAEEYAKKAGMQGVVIQQAEAVTVAMPQSLTKQMPVVIAGVNRYHAAALKGTGRQAADFWGKRPVVVVFTERNQFASHVRRVEKRSFDTADRASIVVGEDQPAVGVWLETPNTRTGLPPSVEIQVGEKLAAAVLARAAGAKNPVPAWLPEAFGRATSFQAAGPSGRSYLAEIRRNAQLYARNQREAPWNAMAEGVQAQSAQAAFAYWIAYGPRAGKMAVLAKQFTPEENQERVEFPQALQKAQLSGDQTLGSWQDWVAVWR